MTHAHFDCFSGAAGDMMLASCLDASPDPNLLERIENDLKKGIPEIAHEFKITMKKVWRGGMGSIAAKKIDVISIYDHAAAPVPMDDGVKRVLSSDSHSHSHGHSHGHTHVLNSDTTEGGSHSHSHSHGHSHDHNSDSSNIESRAHSHGHAHGHSHDHNSDSSNFENHSHSDAHGHSHDHNSDSSNIESHSHSHANGHGHGHSHDHNSNSSNIESRAHSHGHAHSHDHNSDSSNIENHSHSHAHGHSHSHAHSDNHPPLRNLPQIKKMLLESSREHIPQNVCDLAIQTFTELAIAESYTHGTSSEDTVHFHEVGAIDSIVDVVGTLLALNYLSVTKVSCSALPLGEGSVWTDHGQLPVPAFATMRLLIGMPTCKGPGEKSGTITGELVTPTAAALLRVLTGVADAEKCKETNDPRYIETRVGRAPNFTPRAIGIGAGTKDFVKHPNVIRLILGDNIVEHEKIEKKCPDSLYFSDIHTSKLVTETIDRPKNISIDDPSPTKLPSADVIDTSNYVHVDDPSPTKTPPSDATKSLPYKIDLLTHLQANLDDITAEILAYAIELLLDAGAVDAWVEPIVMKKGRSAHTLNCLFHEGSELESKLLDIIFHHTTSLGVRIQRNIERAALFRKIVKVETKYGHVHVKLGMLKNEIVSVKAEFEDCKALSKKFNVPVQVIADCATKIASENQYLS